MPTFPEIKNSIKEDLIKDFTTGLDKIKSKLKKDSHVYKELLQYQSTLKSIEKDFVKTLISSEERLIQIGKIRRLVFDIVETLEVYDFTKEYTESHLANISNLLTIFIEDTAGNKYECKVPPSILIGRLAVDFFYQMGWVIKNRKQRTVIELVVGKLRKNKRLKSEQTLESARIKNGATLRIFPESIATEPPVKKASDDESLIAQKIESIITKVLGNRNKGHFFPPYLGKEEQDYCFVLMPSGSRELDEIYQSYLKSPLQKHCSLNVERAEGMLSVNSIMEDIWFSINRAKVIIADLSNSNPNVYYELGIAHTLGKKVILISQNKQNIPFLINNIRFIHYEYTPRGVIALKTKIINIVKELIKE